MVALFGSTLFISAILLFWMQPMFGKMILPLFGGSPSVWNTCMVFYQATLLLGYIYAHISTKFLGARYQSIIHICLVLIPLFCLPIHIPSSWQPQVLENPIPGLLMLMVTTIGLPFFVLSTTAPMIQKWFSNTKHAAAGDPYFLYVVSNFGSMIALLGYPTLIEPILRLMEQSKLWFYIYYLFIFLIVVCAVMLWRKFNNLQEQAPAVSQNPLVVENLEKLNPKQKIKWVLLSFVPSSLMLGVTTYLSIDITPVPLLWVIPLATYLLTFILVFSRTPIIPHTLMVKAMPYVVLVSLVYMVSRLTTQTMWITVIFHLITFFACSMVCHGELAQNRPKTDHLTEFYLWISVGGFLGGLFNALIAPLLFKEVLEYPLVVILACLIKPALQHSAREKESTIWDDFILPLLPGVMVLGIYLLIKDLGFKEYYSFAKILIYVVPAYVCFKASNNSLKFGIGVASIIIAYSYIQSINSTYNQVYVKRDFFGIHRISEEPQSKSLYLFQDTTVHGFQRIDQKDDCIPLSYYYPDGPIGQLFEAFQNDEKKTHVAVVGLGTGALACYGNEKQEWTFYEIDPTIVGINDEGEYFTHLVNSPSEVYVVIGDARLSLQNETDKYYDIIILDAFSSDAVPTHLITKEALNIYQKKLNDGGIIAFHTSNKYLDLDPVIGNLAREIGLVALFQHDYKNTSSDKLSSMWVILARKKDDFGKLANDPRWTILEISSRTGVWTDDYSNILSIFRWS